MRSYSYDTPSVLDRRDSRFKSIQGACEVVFHELHKEGIGTSVRQVAVITMEEEDQQLLKTIVLFCLLYIIHCITILFIKKTSGGIYISHCQLL